MSVTPHKPPEKPLPKSWPQPEDGERITITLTANAGVLVAYRDYKFLVDGLHGGGGGYSAVPPEVLELVLEGIPPFDRIDALFFTHRHPDHFSEEAAGRFLERWPEAGVFMPRPGGDVYGLAPGRVAAFLDIPHTGGDDCCHNCIYFSLGGRSLLFLGDAVQEGARFSQALAGLDATGGVDAVVCNPLFLSRREGREALLEGVRPHCIVVNHIPFAQDDKMRNREVVARAVTRYRDELPPVAVLWDPLDRVIL